MLLLAVRTLISSRSSLCSSVPLDMSILLEGGQQVPMGVGHGILIATKKDLALCSLGR